MITDRDRLIQDVIDELRGSTGSLSEACAERDLSDMDDDVTAMVDNQIFECTACGWWCGIEEESSEDVGHDEWICSQCAEEM